MKRFAHILAVITFVVSSTVQPVLAARKTEPSFTMDFKNVSINDLIKTMSKLTGTNFLIDQSVSGNVTLIAPTPVTPKEAWRVFLSVLEMKNLTLEKTGAVYRVVVAREGLQRNIPFYYGNQKGANTQQMIIRLVPLEFVKAGDLEVLLKSFKGRNGQIITFAPANMLILVDTSSHINRLLDMIDRIDKPVDLGTTEFIPIEYASAGEIVKLLQQVFGLQKKAVARGRRKKNVSAGQGFSTRVISDDRTNEIILIGPQTEIDEIKAFISKFDRPVVSGKGQIHVYYLKNADAQTLAETLGRLTQSVGSGRGKNAKTKANAVAQFEGGIRVTADKETNSLIITSSPSDFVKLQSLINKLDRPRQQVYVEAAVLEVLLNNNFEIGLNLTVAKDQEIQGQGGVAFGGLGLGGISTFNLDPTALASINGIFAGAAVIPTGLNIPPLGLILRALQTSDNVRILSTPHLLTSDNQEAEIIVGDNVPFITGQSATSGGSLLTSVERRDVGLTLRVKPQVNESKRIRLEIYQEISSVSSQLPQGLDVNRQGLITRKRSAKTTVVANDRQTIAIGGLIASEQTDSINKVPLLGDLPIIGRLFRSTKKASKRTNLIIFIKPTIVRNSDDFSDYAADYIRKFRKMQGLVPSRNVNYHEFFNLRFPSEGTKTAVPANVGSGLTEATQGGEPAVDTEFPRSDTKASEPVVETESLKEPDSVKEDLTETDERAVPMEMPAPGAVSESDEAGAK